MLLCDVCNGGFHIHCLVPALGAVPEGDWTCWHCSDHDDLTGSSEEAEAQQHGGKRRRQQTERLALGPTLLERLFVNEARVICGCGALATARLPRVQDCAPAPNVAAVWPPVAGPDWKCAACSLGQVEQIYSNQRQALVEFAPDLAGQVPAGRCAPTLSWRDPPRGPAQCTSKRGWRFGPSLDTLLAFALERFGRSTGRKQRDFVRAWEEYFQCLPDENKLVVRYRNQIKAGNSAKNPLLQFVQRVDAVAVAPAAAAAGAAAKDEGDGDGDEDGDEVVVQVVVEDDKETRIQAALAPYKKGEWPEPKACQACHALVVSGELHSCVPCSGVSYCRQCAHGHSGAHKGVLPVTQWDVRLPPVLGTKQIKALAKVLGVSGNELRRYI